MAGEGGTRRAPRLTARGAATRERIVSAAAELMYTQGVGATSVDDVIDASGTGKSQLYHYFADKDALVEAVVETQIERVLAVHTPLLESASTMRGLQRWRDAVVTGTRTRQGAYGCPLGSLASELADQSEAVRVVLLDGFGRWEGLLRAVLDRMRESGELAPDADPGYFAAGLVAALQGGLLLAQIRRDAAVLATALDLALDHLRSFLVAKARIRPAETHAATR